MRCSRDTESRLEEIIRFDVNASILFTELPLLQRPAAVAAAGFDAIELWWPFPDPAPSAGELDGLRAALNDAGVRLVGLNFDAGDMAAGDRGLVSWPGHEQRFRDNVDVVVDFAASLGCGILNALYGNRVDGVDASAQEELAVENLAYAARAAERTGATVVVEAINSHENPRYPLVSAKDALAVLDRVAEATGAANLGFLCDVYHLARMGEDGCDVVTSYADRIKHVQIADVPGRHEPGTGALDLDAVFTALQDREYAGYVGLEYKPSGASADSFGWLPRERRPSRPPAADHPSKEVTP